MKLLIEGGEPLTLSYWSKQNSSKGMTPHLRVRSLTQGYEPCIKNLYEWIDPSPEVIKLPSHSVSGVNSSQLRGLTSHPENMIPIPYLWELKKLE